MRALALTIGLLAAGCYDMNRTLPGADVLPGDGPAPDRPVGPDGPAPDGGPPDAPRPELPTNLDGPWPDKHTPDIEPPVDTKLPPDTTVDGSGTCNIKSEINPNAPSCNQQCVPPTVNDTDCDGLPGTRDPWPTGCNKVTLAEELEKDPATTSTWTSTGSWSCGQLDLAAGQSLKLTTLAPLASTRFFVETKFTLGAITDPTRWGVRISSVPAPQTSRYTCELWRIWGYVNPTTGAIINYQQNPGVHTSVKCSGSWDPSANFPGIDGITYYLQQYYTTTGEEACRLLDANGNLLASKSLSPCSMIPESAKGLTVSTYGRAATIHHVRVFEAP